MNKIKTPALLIGTAFLLGACAQTKGLKSGTKTESILLSSQQISSAHCNRGLFMIDVQKNRSADNAIHVNAKGFVTSKPLAEGADPYVILGARDKNRRDPKFSKIYDAKALGFTDLGQSIQLVVGTESPPPPASYQENGQTDMRKLRELMRPVREAEGSPARTITLDRHKDGAVYATDFGDQDAIDFIDIFSEGKAATNPEGSGGVQGYKSVMIHAPKLEGALSQAFAIPSDVEPKEKAYASIDAEIGTPLVIELGADATRPANAAAVIAVRMKDLAGDKPAWKAAYDGEDPAGGSISIDTAKLKASDRVEFVVSRRYQVAVAMPEASGGGTLCVETASDVVTLGSIKEKAE